MLSVPAVTPIQLSTVSRSDTGHDLFHANAGAGIACASCHAEGTDDGRTWTFACEGTRRTQSLQVGLKGTEPFHWGGDEKDFPQLVSDVFVGRMSGPMLAPDQIDATLSWIDAQPRRTHTQPTDTAAIARGKALFNDPTRAACADLPQRPEPHEQPVGRRRHGRHVPGAVARRHRHARAVHARRLRGDAARPLRRRAAAATSTASRRS